MNLLLDTCTFLWITQDSALLSNNARNLFLDPDNDLFLSAASAWEIAVKYAAGRLPLPEPPDRFVPSRRAVYEITALPLGEAEALYASKLPRAHNDPFDRMLICQSIVHGLPILSPDPMLAHYPVRLIW